MAVINELNSHAVSSPLKHAVKSDVPAPQLSIVWRVDKSSLHVMEKPVTQTKPVTQNLINHYISYNIVDIS